MPVDLTMCAWSERFASDDERWRDQIGDLVADLQREVGALRRGGPAVPGSKGLAESVIVALSSAGVFQAAASCFRAWLARDRTRRLTLIWSIDGVERRVVLEGTALDEQTFVQLAEEVRTRVGELTWQSDDTAHS